MSNGEIEAAKAMRDAALAVCDDWATEGNHAPARLIARDIRAIPLPDPTPDLSEEDLAWRCFHCDAIFTHPSDALAHFGRRGTKRPVCEGVDPREAALAKARDALERIDMISRQSGDTFHDFLRPSDRVDRCGRAARSALAGINEAMKGNVS